MSFEQDLTGAVDRTDALRAAAAALESLRQSREGIVKLLRCGISRPSWQPKCPFLASDKDLARRLDSRIDHIEGARKRLIDKRTDLLRDTRSRSPFTCPSELQQRIDYLNLLYSHARKRNLQEFLRAYKRTSAEMCLNPQQLAAVQQLSNIAQVGLEKAAREYADRSGEMRGWPGWQSYRDMYIKDHVGGYWQTVSDFLRQLLDDAHTELRFQEVRHDAVLERQVESQLTTQVAELRKAFAEADVIMTEVQAVHDSESAAVQAIRKVWESEGIQALKGFVCRDGKSLREVDRLLAVDWAREFGGGDYWVGAMESARCAELVALDIYRDLYGDVEDLSILQKVKPSDTRWKTADIDAAGRRIDVKNARRSYSSRNSYSEHCVKQFKLDQRNRPVIVSGFLSPYRTGDAWRMDESIVWLGETTLETIESLRSQFETDYLKLDLSGNWAIRIPPWLFDYPPECYAERNAALASGRSQSFILPRSNCPLGFLVLTGRVERSFLEEPLSEEILAFTRRIAAGSTPTRPMLFLHVLDRFCRTIHDGAPFPSKALRQILFWSDDETPLAVLDPLETVKELLDVLEQVVENCAQRAVAFMSFKLTGAGVFQGRCSDGTWQTIFAYCGGWRKHPIKVKCGQNPLFIGQNKPCDACGKLVCHKCGYCSKTCRLCSPRQAEWPTS